MSEFPAGEAFGKTIVVRAWEPPEEVVVPFSLAHSEGMQPEDYGVLLRLLLRDPQRPSSVLALSEEFQASGWKMGEKRLREVMKRLKAAGHVQHLREYNPSTKRPEWQFRVFRNPANNAAYTRHGADSFSQVRPIRRKTADRGSDAVSDPAETGVCAGQADPAEFGGSAPIRRNSADRNEDVFAGQADRAENGGSASSPPQTPPGGLVNPPTVPPRPTTPESVVAAGAGGNTMRTAQHYNPATAEIAVTDAEIEAAGVFLANLPGRWACGAEDITKYARLLAEAAKRWGWPLGEELEARLTDMTGTSQKIRGHYPRVIPARLKRLPLYAAFKRGEAAASPAQGRRGPVEGACPNHPHRTAAECLPCQADSDEEGPVQRPVREVPDDAIAAAKAMVQSGKHSGHRRDKTPRSEARARRQSAVARSAEAEAEAEENRLKAAALLRQATVGDLGPGVIPDQAAHAAAPQQR
ncbi:hypothetical protein ACIPJN_38575 [Streptomyces sp. NPDC086796]|uniref:hypothetical protein n=1 Tax=unclassified Streptomyces TaxID=2593676 RepID=UPI0037F5EE46